MKHKVSELEGALLDAAVAKAEEKPYDLSKRSNAVSGGGAMMHWTADDVRCVTEGGFYCPSSNWLQAGPIIERERIDLISQYSPSGFVGYAATCMPGAGGKPFSRGPTPLIAAMRAFVAAKLGDEVELP